QVRFAFVAIRDVQELHHVGLVLPLAGQRASDLLADRRAVIGKRPQPRLVSLFLEAVAEQFRLRLLAALVQSFEGDEKAGHQDSRRSMSSTVCRRRTTRQAPASTSTSAGNGRRL